MGDQGKIAVHRWDWKLRAPDIGMAQMGHYDNGGTMYSSTYQVAAAGSVRRKGQGSRC
jgi:hypothetical protein